MAKDVRILQIGAGGFGRNHLKAWVEMGLADRLYVADLSPQRRAECAKYRVPPEQIGTDYRAFLDKVDVVDIVTSTDSHFDLCKAAIEAGKDVFVEKPMTANSDQAKQLADLVAKRGRILQVGYYYRFHPLSIHAHEQVQSGALGTVRYVTGNFMGFKRARTDVGVTHTDGIHFLDLFNFILGAFPREVYAVVRDHFGRGMEDFSIVLLQYPGQVVGKVESGYIQPGKWRDKVVPNAVTSKEIAVVGSTATIEVDYETERAALHDVHHELRDGIWAAAMGPTTSPNVGTANTVELLGRELTAFLESVASRKAPSADAPSSGVALALLIEAIYESARTGRPVALPGA